MTLEWRTVLPACSGKCSNAPKLGWITTGITKKGVTAGKTKRKRKNIDLRSFVPRPIEGNFDDWLADSKPACNSAVSGRGILEGRGVDEDSDGGGGQGVCRLPNTALVWDQLLFELRTKRQIKRRRKKR